LSTLSKIEKQYGFAVLIAAGGGDLCLTLLPLHRIPTMCLRDCVTEEGREWRVRKGGEEGEEEVVTTSPGKKQRRSGSGFGTGMM
jgi:hypothetical protein